MIRSPVTCLFIFSTLIGVPAIIVASLAILRSSPSATAPVTNNFAAIPSVPPVPPSLPISSSLLVPTSATGDQEGFYFLTFHNDPICSGGNQLYDPVSDPQALSTGLSSNPISVDRSQAPCCTIGYGSSVGVLAASQRYLSFRQFASDNCSGTYQDYIRIPLSNPSPVHRRRLQRLLLPPASPPPFSPVARCCTTP
jgi:hypothetical protein